MSWNNLVSKYSTEEAQSMLEEDSDNDELDEETISDDRHSLSGISDISSDEEDLYYPLMQVAHQIKMKICIAPVIQVAHQMKTKNQLVMLPCSFQMAKLGLLCCLRDQFAQIHPILYMSIPESILLFAARLQLVLMIVGNC